MSAIQGVIVIVQLMLFVLLAWIGLQMSTIIDCLKDIATAIEEQNK